MMNWYKPNKRLQFAPEFIPKVTSNQVKDLIESGYSRTGDAEDIGNLYGLKLDKSLSKANHKVFYDKVNKFLMSSVALSISIEKSFTYIVILQEDSFANLQKL